MFNSTSINLGRNSTTVSLNAPSTGILQRSHSKSTFVRFQRGSNMEKWVFPSDGTNPYIHKFDYSHGKYNEYRDTDYKIEVVVLQILIFGNDQYLVEVVETKYLQDENEEK